MSEAATRGSWKALWTRSHCERLVRDQLASRGFHPFLPTMRVWSVRAGVPHRVGIPMFPGYLFLQDELDRTRFFDVQGTRGLVAVLGTAWNRPAVVSDEEIAVVQRLANVDLPMRPHPFVREGERVRVRHGPLAGLEGILVRFKPKKDLVVVSVGLLQRSVAVEVDCGFVDAA